MNPSRFDTVAKALGRHTSRRAALSGGVTGLAAVAGLAAGRRVHAQEATPATTAQSFPDDPHPSAGTASHTEFLFTQSFQSGTWAPKPGEDDVYTLTLTNVPAQIVYFSDRPERIFGVTPTQPFLDGLGFTPANPPNAALIAQLEPGSDDEEVLVIELFNPVYDPDSQTMTYDAKILADYSGHGLAHAAHQQSDYSLPAEFAHGSLFIDDCPGKQGNFACYFNGTLQGYVYVDLCWNGSQCTSCQETPQIYCGWAYGSCYNEDTDQYLCTAELYD